MLMLIQALLAGLVVGISKMDYFFGYNMLNRPIVEGALMGLVLGDPVTGTIIGATLEIVFLGSFPVGAAVSPDGGTAAGVSTAFAIITAGRRGRGHRVRRASGAFGRFRVCALQVYQQRFRRGHEGAAREG